MTTTTLTPSTLSASPMPGTAERPLTKLDRLAQVLVLLGAIGVSLSPAGWFGVGSLDYIHMGQPGFHDHGKFHLMWQGISYFMLGGASLYAVTQPRAPVFRWIGAGIPLAVFSAYFIVAYIVAPMLGVTEPLSHYQPNAYGIRSNVFWISVMLIASTTGLILNLRATRAAA